MNSNFVNSRKSKFDEISPSHNSFKMLNSPAMSQENSFLNLNPETLPVGLMATYAKKQLFSVYFNKIGKM